MCPYTFLAHEDVLTMSSLEMYVLMFRIIFNSENLTTTLKINTSCKHKKNRSHYSRI